MLRRSFLITTHYTSTHTHTPSWTSERFKKSKKKKHDSHLQWQKRKKLRKKNWKIGQLPRHHEQLTEAGVMRSDSSANGIFLRFSDSFLNDNDIFFCNIKEYWWMVLLHAYNHEYLHQASKACEYNHALNSEWSLSDILTLNVSACCAVIHHIRNKTLGSVLL